MHFLTQINTASDSLIDGIHIKNPSLTVDNDAITDESCWPSYKALYQPLHGTTRKWNYVDWHSDENTLRE
jgi:hypothetical protein